MLVKVGLANTVLIVILWLCVRNGVLAFTLIAHGTQLQFNLTGDEQYQNVPFRINAHTDVPLDIVTDMSGGGCSYLAVSMDANAMSEKIFSDGRTRDPDYSALFGWKNTANGSIYFDRKSTHHDNGWVYIHLGSQGAGIPNHVMIGDFYVMPYGMGKPGQVITVPTNGNQLVWSWPTAN